MSVDLYVYCSRSKLPSPQEWQDAIAARGFAVQLDVEFDLFDHSGFLPANYEGKPGGFEYYFDDDLDLEDAPENLEGRDSMVQFSTHSDMREAVTSVIAAGVLAYMTEGILVDPQSGEEMGQADVLAWTKEVENEMRQDLD